MFDSRIEFYNIGGLATWITPKNITVEQYSRNSTIAKILAKVKYIEELGEGWNKIIKEHKEHYLKPKMPKIQSTENSTLVSLFSTKGKFEQGEGTELSPRQKKILGYIKREKRITTGLCAKFLRISSDTALRELTKMSKLGIITRKGKGKGIYYTLQ